MARAKASPSGIVLSQKRSDRTFELVRPGQLGVRSFSEAMSLDGIAKLAGLSNGYWVRGAATPTAETWMWVQL